METHVLFFLATVAAGAINALAGGGGLITLPVLVLVLAASRPPVRSVANLGEHSKPLDGKGGQRGQNTGIKSLGD